jgi:predicted lipoprotein with Yx(FWY)xxD motif
MTHRRHTTLLATAAVLPAVVLSAAGCGGGNGTNNNGRADGTAAKTAGGRPATIGVENGGLGQILDDSKGRTVYLFQKDKGTTSACTGGCAAAWPPVRVSGKPIIGKGASASAIGTTKRPDGGRQVTYNGHPLYTYTGDQQPGDTNGQGLTAFGGGWFALSPAGTQIAGSGTSSGSSPY